MGSHSGFDALGNINLDGNFIHEFAMATETVASGTNMTVADTTGVVLVTGSVDITTIATAKAGRELLLIFTSSARGHKINNSTAANGVLCVTGMDEALPTVDYYIPQTYTCVRLIGLDVGGSDQWVIANAPLQSYLTGTTATTFAGGVINAQSHAAFPITVTGAALGDFVWVSHDVDVQDVILTADVTAADTVNVVFSNIHGTGAAIGDGNAYVRVYKRT